MKIVTVVGARPQFIKAAALSRMLRREHTEILVHTGQHYDENMSQVFFDEMGIPAPDYNLGIAGGTHAQMTGCMLMAIEEALLLEKPDMLLVYGDTNSTLAAALAAVKLHIPIAHVEAGNRFGTLRNPEEVNRILTDHCAALLFCATEDAYRNLEKEGLAARARVTGNIMYDSFLHFANQPWERPALASLAGTPLVLPERYYYMTCHRQENTGDEGPLNEILSAMDSLDAPTVYPVHPRSRERAERLCREHGYNNILLTIPVKYSDSVHLTQHAIKIVTDSGGLQCEAFYAGVQCVFVFDRVLWPETMVGNRNQLAKTDKKDIMEKLKKEQHIDPAYRPFGDGHAAERICGELKLWEMNEG